MRSYQSCPRPTSVLLAALVGVFTMTCAARATQTNTTPDASSTSYTLAAGANSKPITPPANQSVYVSGVCNTSGTRGVGHVSMLHVPGSFLEWVGINSPSNATITSGFSSTPGTAIVGINFGDNVVIQVNSADTFVVHNGTGGTMAGSVKMIW